MSPTANETSAPRANVSVNNRKRVFEKYFPPRSYKKVCKTGCRKMLIVSTRAHER